MTRLRLGTRKSALAQAQSRWVAERLRDAFPKLTVEYVLITTTGDKLQHPHPQPLSRLRAGAPFGAQARYRERVAGGRVRGGLKALWTKEIEDALLKRRIDLAVHSLKDMASELPKGLILAAVPKREDPHDAWISRKGLAFKDLPQGARVATDAVRRQAQLKRWRPDIRLAPMRGNVDTRLNKLAASKWDGMILALAGLKRLGRADAVTEVLPLDVMLPAVGQGALAIETRRNDPAIAKIVKAINDPASFQAALAERMFLKTLGGSCQTPIAAYATISGKQLTLTGLVAAPEGKPCHQAAAVGPVKDAETIGQRLGQLLLAQGADKILK